ncbi:hypothetical protein PQI66_00340 [Corynebacterium sp. USCH3]|uniref:hypothetical protein n=1 Tax=Corynebacterium sp. USCH3 TaxID=3024840 RepID=UPI0030B18CF7
MSDITVDHIAGEYADGPDVHRNSYAEKDEDGALIVYDGTTRGVRAMYSPQAWLRLTLDG